MSDNPLATFSFSSLVFSSVESVIFWGFIVMVSTATLLAKVLPVES